MNNCILMAEIIKEPQLRYTADNLEITEMLVQFPAVREGEPPATLKVVGWGKLATDIQQNYHEGDRVLLEGRLGMHTIERPEGFKEKRAELTVQKIHNLGGGTVSTSASVPAAVRTPSTSVATTTHKPTPSYEPPQPTPTPATSNVNVMPQDDFTEPVPQTPNYERRSYPTAVPNEETDVDDIPF